MIAAIVEASELSGFVGGKLVIDISISKPCLIEANLKSPG